MTSQKLSRLILVLVVLSSLFSCASEDSNNEASSLSQELLKLSVTPISGDSHVSTNLEVIALSFNKAISLEDIDVTSISLTPKTEFHLDTSLLTSRKLIFLVLDQKLSANTDYKFTIGSITDKETGENQSFEWQYKTESTNDFTAPVLLSSTPLASATGITDKLSRIELTFDENITLNDLNNITITPAIPGSRAVLNNKLIITPGNSLIANQNYNLTVSSVSDFFGNTAADISINFTTGNDTSAPSASTLSLTSPASMTSASLSWSVSTDTSGIASYTLKRGNSSSNLSVLNTFNSNTLTFTDSTLTPGTGYFYQIEITDQNGVKNNSNIINIQTLSAPDTTPPVPGNLTLIGSPTTSSITVQWLKATDNIAILKYDLIRTENNGQNTTTVSTMSSDNSASYQFTDNSVNSSTQYEYKVRVTDTSNNIAQSNTLITNTPAPAPPAPPTSRPLTLTWDSPTRNSDNSCLTDLQSYNIEVKPAAGNYTHLDNVATSASNLSCTATGTDSLCGTNVMSCTYVTSPFSSGTWFFKVQASNTSSLVSGYSNEASIVIN